MFCLVVYVCYYLFIFYMFVSLVFFFKQKTAYEMRISDWSSDVCSSDLSHLAAPDDFLNVLPDQRSGSVQRRRGFCNAKLRPNHLGHGLAVECSAPGTIAVFIGIQRTLGHTNNGYHDAQRRDRTNRNPVRPTLVGDRKSTRTNYRQ